MAQKNSLFPGSLDTFFNHGNKDGIGLDIDWQKSDELSSEEVDLITDAILEIERKLANIGTTTVSADQWAFLGALLGYSNRIDQQFNNLLKNGSFEDSALPVANTPSGWTLEGTPTVAVEVGNIAVGYGIRSAKITGTAAANEGLNQTITGLKASTTYTIRWHSMVTAGDTARLFTTGATTNADTDVTAVSMTQSVATFITDAGGTDVVLKVVAKVAGDIVYFDNITVVEGNIAPAYSPHPNDQHLKAIDYQDTTPTNYDYGLLRMECGIARAVHVNAWDLDVTITFGTAFSKIVAFSFLPNYGSQNGIGTEQVDNVMAITLTTTTSGCRVRDGAGGMVAGDWIDCPWIAIGLN